MFLIVIIFLFAITYYVMGPSSLVYILLGSCLALGERIIRSRLEEGKRRWIFLLVLFLSVSLVYTFPQGRIFMVFLPLLLQGKELLGLISLVPILWQLSPSEWMFFGVGLLCSLLLHHIDGLSIKLKEIRQKGDQEGIALRWELEKKQREAKQRKEHAILEERNRISTELHHLIGHTITSSLLQVGAMEMTVDDPVEKEALARVRTTLNEGMDSIRRVLHQMKEEAVDWEAAFNGLVEKAEAAGLTVHRNINVSLMDQSRKKDVLSILREGITNTLKHSDATEFHIRIASHPAFDVVEMWDNGTSFVDVEVIENGIGLRSMKEMALAYDGLLQISGEEGFHVRITLMDKTEEDTPGR